MRIRVCARAALAALAVILSARAAHAQAYESIGIRAQGMAGAFVALADDATATWWNPAGIAQGAYLDSLIEYGIVQDPAEEQGPSGRLLPARETRGRGLAFSFPAAGISYYRIQLNEIQPLGPTAEPLSGREDEGAASARLRSVVLNQFGLTIGQSLGNHLVIASTLKLVRGKVATATVAPADATFEQARDLEGDGGFRADLDIGALVTLGIVRLGASMKNVRSPEFGPEDRKFELAQRSRAGVAIVGHGGGFDQISVSADVDLTTAESALGNTRYAAVGGEAWVFGRRIGLRGGVSRNLEGEELMTPAGGISLAWRPGAYLEGHYQFGSDEARRGWGAAMRVTF